VRQAVAPKDDDRAREGSDSSRRCPMFQPRCASRYPCAHRPVPQLRQRRSANRHCPTRASLVSGSPRHRVRTFQACSGIRTPIRGSHRGGGDGLASRWRLSGDGRRCVRVGGPAQRPSDRGSPPPMEAEAKDLPLLYGNAGPGLIAIESPSLASLHALCTICGRIIARHIARRVWVEAQAVQGWRKLRPDDVGG